MSSSPLERVVKHDFRLDILCCMVDGEPLAVSQLSAETGKPPRAVAHHVELLDAHDLVEKMDDEGGAALYAATLERHPGWVAEAVKDHRQVV